MAEIFVPFVQSTLTRNLAFKLVQPFRNTRLGQNGLSYIGPSARDGLDSNDNDSKNISNLNTFKHNLKRKFFNINRIKENDIYNY